MSSDSDYPTTDQHESEQMDSDHSLANYHGALSAATRLGLKLELGDTTHRDASLPTLEKLFQSADQQAPRGQSSRLRWIEDQIQSNTPSLPRRYLAGWWLAEVGEDLPAVLDGWRVKPEIKQELAGTLRPTWLYLTLPMLLATAGLLYFVWHVAPIIDALRADMHLTPKIDLVAPHLSTEWARLIAAFLPLFTLIWFAVGWSNWGCAALTYWFGGQRYARGRNEQIRGRLRAAAVATGQPSETVESMIDCLIESKPSAHTHSQPNRFAIENAKSIVTQQQRSSQETLTAMRLIAPSFLVVAVGGGIVAAYSLILFWPLIGLLYDLAGPLRETF